MVSVLQEEKRGVVITKYPVFADLYRAILVTKSKGLVEQNPHYCRFSIFNTWRSNTVQSERTLGLFESPNPLTWSKDEDPSPSLERKVALSFW